MKVSELIEELQQMPQDSIVILQKDPEGNGFSPLSDVAGLAVWIEDSSEVYSTMWSAANAGMDEEMWALAKKNCPACVVLFPTS